MVYLQLNRQRKDEIGDLAYCNSDGLICFVGGADLQIKIDGQRVEMSEAEYHVSTCPAVSKSTVLFPKSGRFSKRLVAVVQLTDIISQFPASDENPSHAKRCAGDVRFRQGTGHVLPQGTPTGLHDSHRMVCHLSGPLIYLWKY